MHTDFKTCEICGEETPANSPGSVAWADAPEGRLIHKGPCFLEFGISQNTPAGSALREAVGRLGNLLRERAASWKLIATEERARIAALEAENALLRDERDAGLADLERIGGLYTDLQQENAALRRELQRAPGEGLVSVPEGQLPTADEVYGILTPCPCRFADQPEHGPGWCVRGREIDEEDLASDEP